jgi:hypothetical protein
MEAFSPSGPSGSVPFIGGIGWFGGHPGEELSPLTEEPGSWIDEVSEPPIDVGMPPSTFPGGDGPGPHPSDGGHQDPPTTWDPSFEPPGGGPPGEPPLHVPNGEPPPVVPEPTSLTLFGTGALWMALKRYRQRGRSL